MLRLIISIKKKIIDILSIYFLGVINKINVFKKNNTLMNELENKISININELKYKTDEIFNKISTLEENNSMLTKELDSIR
ncbi:hypothetical protein, partial [Rosenbergiella australiborealis]|uniref:hypothetical protein n=1 Tax=Rosenbergiella australiborealis TaxID=1544696 RepID=UPI001F4E59AA